MKLIFVLEDIGASGAWVVTRRLAEILCHSGHEVHYYIYSSRKFIKHSDGLNEEDLCSSKKSSKISISLNIKILIINLVKSLVGRFIISFIKSFFVSKRIFEEFDKVYLVDLKSKVLFSRINHTDITSVLHNIKSLQISTTNYPGRLADRYIFTNILQNKKIIAVSGAVKNDVMNNFNVASEMIKVVYNPIDISYWRSCVNKLKQIDINDTVGGNKYFIAVGRLSSQKRYDRLLFAYRNYLNSLPQNTVGFNLMIFGEGPEKTRLFKLSSKLKLDSKIRILPYSKSIGIFISGAEAILISSDFEGFSTVAIESIALEKPVLSVPIPPMIEIGTYFGGVYFSSEINHSSLATLMLDFTENKLHNYEKVDLLENNLLNINTIAKEYLRF